MATATAQIESTDSRRASKALAGAPQRHPEDHRGLPRRQALSIFSRRDEALFRPGLGIYRHGRAHRRRRRHRQMEEIRRRKPTTKSELLKRGTQQTAELDEKFPQIPAAPLFRGRQSLRPCGRRRACRRSNTRSTTKSIIAARDTSTCAPWESSRPTSGNATSPNSARAGPRSQRGPTHTCAICSGCRPMPMNLPVNCWKPGKPGQQPAKAKAAVSGPELCSTRFRIRCANSCTRCVFRTAPSR